jgi:RNA polymerase sigma-70 factor, ECF subfamily
VPPTNISLSVTDMALLGQHWEEYRPRLLAMIGRRIGPALAVRVDPEEVLSETFLDAARDWPRFRGQSAMAPYPWLYRLALDRVIETWRKQSRGVRDVRRDVPWPDESAAHLGLNMMDAGTSPSAAVIRGELRDRVRQALEQLKPEHRELLWLRHADDLKFGEIAQVLGVTENTATVRYLRALKRLREFWDAADRTGSNP